MAPPAIKRRKLEHSDSETDSDGSFADFDATNGVMESDGSDAEGAQDESDDVSMDGAHEMDDNDEDDNDGDEDGDEDMSEDADEDHKANKSVQENKKQTADGKATSAAKLPSKRPALSLQDGVYTAESFKSNMFKLQVDELLDQVKLKYGKKEAPAENAMRTLKTIIEQIPSRDPLPVGHIPFFNMNSKY